LKFASWMKNEPLEDQSVRESSRVNQDGCTRWLYQTLREGVGGWVGKKRMILPVVKLPVPERGICKGTATNTSSGKHCRDSVSAAKFSYFK